MNVETIFVNKQQAFFLIRKCLLVTNFEVLWTDGIIFDEMYLQFRFLSENVDTSTRYIRGHPGHSELKLI